MADDEITRREALKAAGVLGGGVAVGYLARESTQDPAQMIGGGGGGGPIGDQLVIGAGVSIAVDELQWYSGILWEQEGSLELDDGDPVGLLEHNE